MFYNFFNGNNEPLLKGKEVGAEESNVPAIEDDDDIIEKLDEMINGCWAFTKSKEEIHVHFGFSGYFSEVFWFVEEIFNGGIFVKAFIRLQHCEGYTNF